MFFIYSVTTKFSKSKNSSTCSESNEFLCPQFVFLNSKKIKISCFECAQLAWLHKLCGCHHRAYVVQHAGEYYIKSTNIDANKYVNWCQKKFRPTEFRRLAPTAVSRQFCYFYCSTSLAEKYKVCVFNIFKLFAFYVRSAQHKSILVTGLVFALSNI